MKNVNFEIVFLSFYGFFFIPLRIEKLCNFMKLLSMLFRYRLKFVNTSVSYHCTPLNNMSL